MRWGIAPTLILLACHTSATAPAQVHADALLAARTVLNTVCSWPRIRCDSVVIARPVIRSANDLPTPAETLAAFTLADSLEQVVPFHQPLRFAATATPSTAPGLVFVSLYAVTRASSDTLHRYVVAVYTNPRSSPDIGLVILVRHGDRWISRRPSFLVT